MLDTFQVDDVVLGNGKKKDVLGYVSEVGTASGVCCDLRHHLHIRLKTYILHDLNGHNRGL